MPREKKEKMGKESKQSAACVSQTLVADTHLRETTSKAERAGLAHRFRGSGPGHSLFCCVPGTIENMEAKHMENGAVCLMVGRKWGWGTRYTP